MKFFYCFLLCIIFQGIKAQSINVLNSHTKKPVPFATVLAKLKGEPVSRDYCSQDGSLKMSVKNYDALEISCIGFADVVLNKADVSAEILMQPNAFQLDEVIITGHTNVVTVGYIDKEKNDFSGVAAEFQDAVFIPNTIGGPGYIKSFLFKIVKAKNRFAYRLHFYKPAIGRNHPGEEVTPANIIGFIEKDAKGLTELDLSLYAVEFPEGGLFVSVEGLGACNVNGAIIETKDAYITYEDFQSAEPIYFHQPEFFISTGWINQNERIIRDYKENRNSKPPLKALRVPSFGLKIFR